MPLAFDDFLDLNEDRLYLESDGKPMAESTKYLFLVVKAL